MKKIILIVSTAVLFISCSKSKDDTPVPGQLPSNMVRVKTKVSGSTSSTYSYDGLGRVTQIVRSDGSKHVYEYTPGKVTTKNYNTSGVYVNSNFEELNADGYTIRSTETNNPGYEALYFYNADKTMAKQVIKTSNYTSIFDYFWSNGNLDSTRISNGNGVWNYTGVTTFFLDKPAKLANEEFGEALWGKESKNLKKSYYNKYPNGTTSEEYSLSYEYDAQGRVTKSTNTGNNEIFITLYTY